MSTDVISPTLWHRETNCLEENSDSYFTRNNLMSEPEWKRDIIASKQFQKNSMIFLAKSAPPCRVPNMSGSPLSTIENASNDTKQQFKNTVDTNERILPVKKNPILCHDLEIKSLSSKEAATNKLNSIPISPSKDEAKSIKATQNILNEYKNIKTNDQNLTYGQSNSGNILSAYEEDEEVKYGKGFVSKLLKKFNHIAGCDDAPGLQHSTSVPYISHPSSYARQNSESPNHSNKNTISNLSTSSTHALSTNDLHLGMSARNSAEMMETFRDIAEVKNVFENNMQQFYSARRSVSPNIGAVNLNQNYKIAPSNKEYSINYKTTINASNNNNKNFEKREDKNIKNESFYLPPASVPALNKPSKLIYSSNTSKVIANTNASNNALIGNRADNLLVSNYNNISNMKNTIIGQRFNYEKNVFDQSGKSDQLHAQNTATQCNNNYSNYIINSFSTNTVNNSNSSADNKEALHDIMVTHYSAEKSDNIIHTNVSTSVDIGGMNVGDGVTKITTKSYLVKSKPDISISVSNPENIPANNSSVSSIAAIINKNDLTKKSDLKATTATVSAYSTTYKSNPLTPMPDKIFTKPWTHGNNSPSSLTANKSFLNINDANEKITTGKMSNTLATVMDKKEIHATLINIPTTKIVDPKLLSTTEKDKESSITKPKDTNSKTLDPKLQSSPAATLPLNSLVSTSSYSRSTSKSQDLDSDILRTNKKRQDQSATNRPGSLLIRPASNLAASKTDSAYLHLTKYNDIKKGEFMPPKISELDPNEGVFEGDTVDAIYGVACGYVFEGACVKLGKSSMRTNKIGKIKKVNFDDSENIFEYPPEEPFTDDLSPTLSSPSGSLDYEGEADKSALITSITSGTGNLSSYVSKSAVSFEFGMSQISPDRSDVLKNNLTKIATNNVIEVDEAAWSNGAEMLF